MLSMMVPSNVRLIWVENNYAGKQTSQSIAGHAQLVNSTRSIVQSRTARVGESRIRVRENTQTRET